jgi:plasmid stabilization system protein ParE
MGNYKLSDEAEADVIRIHQWGVRNHGEEQADRYFAALFDHFERHCQFISWNQS